jgi:hypothetical protein
MERTMRKYGLIAGVCAGLLVSASTASAQDTNKTGLTMSSGSSIGVLVPVGDNAAIRATLGFARATSDYVGSQFVDDSISTTTLIPGASVLFYLKSWDATRLYVSPQYSYSRVSSSSDNADARGSHSAAFMVGAQHSLGARFGVFAEGGLGWSRSKSTVSSQFDTSSITSSAWSTRATVGGILFF